MDTCVLSESTKPSGEERVRRRIAALHSRGVYLSVISLGEIATGIALLEPGAEKDRLAAFLLDLEQDFGERILPVDTETARIWGETTAAARKRGRSISPTNGWIAATALRHGLHLMTRNVSDFAETGVLLINPWDGD